MRSARQIDSTVEEYHDWQRAERRRHLAAVLSMLRKAREERAEWYVWVLEYRSRRLEGLDSGPAPPDALERQGSLL